MKLSVIIVNYNTKYFLEQCLHAVLSAARNANVEVIVVDNNSSDGSMKYLPPLFPGVRFIESVQNLGFGKANNLALKSARGEYILFLNPDTIVPEDCLENCLGFLDANAAAGALGIKMIDGSGRFLPESKRSFPTTSSSFYKLSGLSSLFPASKHFNQYSVGYLDPNENHKVEVLAGAFLMIKKKVLDQAGGFDEAFFMYGEDIDLSYRIQQAGFENWYFGGSSIIHFKGESTKKQSLKYLKMFYNAMIVFVNKHYPGKRAVLMRSVLKTGITLRGIAGWLFLSAPKKKQPNTPPVIVVVGSMEDFNDCKAILGTEAKYDVPVIHQSTPAPDDIANNSMIIFCNGTCTYKQTISIIERYAARFSYRFHASGSNSIIGSDSKEFPGEAIAIQR